MPVVAAVGTAVPSQIVTQEEGRAFARRLFDKSFRDIERLLAVFESSQIDKRHFCVPLEWFEREHSWREKNLLYRQYALDLSRRAILDCLEQGGLRPEDVDALVFVSSSGISTPSIDAYLMNQLAFRSDLRRLPLWGLGCAGGAAGLARGFELAKAYPESRVLVCAVELCGLTFVHGDRSKSNLIATSLFADGGAAALILGDEAARKSGAKGPEILGTASHLWPDTLDVMGWEVRDEGLMVIFSRDIPTLVTRQVRRQVDGFLGRHELTLRDVGVMIPHPGGAKVLTAYREALELADGQLQEARRVLREYGNTSSCTVLFVLGRELAAGHRPGELGLVLALGPGFACEQVLLRW